ncbi:MULTISPECIES: TauD/TfdA family dioxygenase [unclassified Phenylobacterium]|uniref:TauD/TfdA family dioxygenase n=1 Tax=unclassified Phenylobacterium TaxID=2640670 RepID=UPI00083A3528|nr:MULTISPECIES: TauD/TfdA family dioxygenase [unclassified Phenylobacterium]
MVLRRELLAGRGAVRPLAVDPAVLAPRPLGDLAPSLQAGVEADGYAIARSSEPVNDETLIELAMAFGLPTPERDPAVLPFTSRGVILNLRSTLPQAGDVALQPFTSGELSLHSESSRKPLAGQPRYLLFLCCDPGVAEAQALTLLTPMAGVAARLDPAARRILEGVRYDGPPGAPSVLREAEGRPVFSFRDFQDEPLDWTYEGPQIDPEGVSAALRSLLWAMYGCQALGLAWSAGLVLLLDNRRYFHGRTSAGPARGGPPRHLKRLRLA